MIAEKTWYKIVDYENGKYKTLFHGINKSRVLEFGKWLEAVMKDVSDGSSATIYTSGWHLIPTYKECIEYLEKFKHRDKKRILKCKAKNIWAKDHSPSNIFLSQFIFIEGEASEH